MSNAYSPCPFCGGTDLHVAGGRFLDQVYCTQCDAYGPARTPGHSVAAWNRRAQPEPAASADPSRDAYEGCREDLLDWKRRALTAEENNRQLTRALADEVNGPTLFGEPIMLAAAPQPATDAEPVASDALCWACGVAINTSQPLPPRPEPLTDAEIGEACFVLYTGPNREDIAEANAERDISVARLIEAAIRAKGEQK